MRISKSIIQYAAPVYKRCLRRPLLCYFVINLILYIVSYRLDFVLGTAIFGLPIFLYFPGVAITRIALPSGLFGKFGRFSLSVIFSFCISSLIGLLIHKTFGFNNDYQIWSVVLFGCLFLTASEFVATLFKSGRQANQNQEPYAVTLLDYLPPVILALAFFGIIAFNFLPQNLDNYLNLLKLSISEARNVLPVRQIFISSFGLSFQILRINITYIYTYLFAMLFLVSTLSLYDFLLKNNGKKIIIYTLFLSFLTAPAILTEVIRTMSQVALLTLTIPTLIMAMASIKYQKISLSIASLALAVISLLFHELGIILVFVMLVVLLINIWRVLFDKNTRIIKYAIPVVLIALIIFFYNSSVMAPTIQRIALRLQENMDLLTQNGGIHWQWWFLDNYKTVEGIQLGWTGFGAVLYYLYDGILLFFPLLILVYYLLKHKMKLGIESIPVVLYFGFYFLVAEIFPRLNLAFLPNRAWVHMMLPTMLLLSLAYNKINSKNLQIKYFAMILIALIAIGFGGTAYLAKNNIYEVYPNEMGVAKYIQINTPSDAIILSSQNNKTLVSIYAERPYGQVSVPSYVDRHIFDLAVNQTLNKMAEIQTPQNDPHSMQAPLKYHLDDSTGILVPEPPYTNGKQVFFLYSYAKIGGLNDKRSYRQEVIDSANKFTYDKLNYAVEYSDKYALLIRVR